MFDFRHYIDLITEAQHDALVDAIIRQFPDKEKEIRDHATWASQVLKKADRINWYLGKLRAYLSDQLTPEVLGDYQFTTMQQLQHDLAHFYGYNSPAIEAYQYRRQPIGDLIRDLRQIETEWTAKQNQERGVDPQTGDYVLFEFADGIKWWWINRAYCSEEGRSGRHCGNVVGKNKTNQRILSLRDNRNRVILTFIREPNGTLGEMKAKGNQKPQEQYHPHIMKLLLWDKIKGISGMGYLPDMNFSVFDLNEKYLNYLDHHKPKLIVDQTNVTPFEILKENIPTNIKQKYLKYAEQKQPAVRILINNNTFEQWLNEIKNNNELIFYLPSEYISKFPNYLDILIEEAKIGNNVLKIPKIISRNFDYMKEIVSEVPRAIGLTNQHADRYEELCKIAVSKQGDVLRLINEENRTFEICKIAVLKKGLLISLVPTNLNQYNELAEIALANDIRNKSHIKNADNIIISHKTKLLVKNNAEKEILNDPHFIKYNPSVIKYLSEETQVEYINQSYNYIYYIDLTENIIKKLIDKNPRLVFQRLAYDNYDSSFRSKGRELIQRVVSNLSEDEQLKLINLFSTVIEFIEKPTDSLIASAAEQKILNAKKEDDNFYRNYKLPEISTSVQLLLIEKNPSYIIFMSNPANETQIEAIKKLYKNMMRLKEWIRNPTDEAKELWTKLTKRKYF